jgi:hypothetical protein
MRLQLGLIGALFVVSLPLAEARAASVAVSIKGAKGSAEDKLDNKVRGQLAARGLEVVSERALQKAAKKARTEPDTVAAALEAGADLWISITIKKVKKKFVAQGKLVDVRSGKTLKSVKRSYKKASSAGAIGDLIGTELAEAALGRATIGGGEAVAGEGDDNDDAADDDEPKQPSQKVVRAQPEESEPVARATPEPTITPKDEEKGASASTTIDRGGPSLVGGEDRVLRLLIGAGSQVTSAYTVAVGPQVTGLAYKLTPLILLDAGVAVQIPNVGLAFELGLSFVPVKYQIDVDPAVMPAAPKGRFLDVGGGALYKLTLARFGGGEQSRFFVAPQIGFQYSSLSVEAQEPYAVVLSWSSVAPYAGAKLGVVLDALALELDARFKFIVSYGEAPDSTGDGGSGTGFHVGAVVRYWMSEHFGVAFRAAYDFSRVSFSGEGSRTPFVDDPPLLDASAYSSDLRASFGVVLGL